jgi:type I restriction-modification system DNA methylase subunit
MRTGGFNAVVGNPPYIRIQNMRVYASEEVDLYNRPTTGFASAGSANFDKYFLFVERALTRVLKPGGRLGMIVTRNFFRSVAGRNLRQLILAKADLDTIVDFGVEQVFPGRSTYTCILVLSRRADGRV